MTSNEADEMTGSAQTFKLSWLFAVALLARLPLAMLSLGMLVHIERLTGSYAAAGAAAGALALAQGVGGPLLGRLVDRRGQTAVLVGSAGLASVALVVAGMLPVGAPFLLLLGLAAVLGLATPPVGACFRTLLPTLVADADRQRSAYSLDTAATELTWVSAPPLVLLLAVWWSTGAALTVASVVLVVATLAFAAAPASRSWRPPPRPVARSAGGALQSPAMRVLVMALIGVGVVFGATEVAVTAAADALGSAGAAGALLGLWGIGSLLGGLAAVRAGGGARTGRGFAVLLMALAAGHLALAPATGSLPALAVVIVLAGTMIAPILSTAYAMVNDAALAGTVTEAYTWLATATALGTSLGSAIAGVAAQAGGPALAFVLAATAAAAAGCLAARSRHLPGRSAVTGSTAPFVSTAQPASAPVAA